jgi:hypothetical protein
LQQRDDVGEPFVECGHVGIRILQIAMMDGVEDRVGGLVSDDIRTQAAEDQTAWIVGTLELIAGREVAEEQRRLARIVVGVGVANRMGIDAQALDVLPMPPRLGPTAGLAVDPEHARIPDDPPAERALEMTDRLHRHRVDELLMELRVAFARRQPVL